MCDLCERVDPLLEMILRGCAVQASRRTPFRITEVVSMISAIKVRDEQRVELALTILDSVTSSFCLSPPSPYHSYILETATEIGGGAVDSSCERRQEPSTPRSRHPHHCRARHPCPGGGHVDGDGPGSCSPLHSTNATPEGRQDLPGHPTRAEHTCYVTHGLCASLDDDHLRRIHVQSWLSPWLHHTDTKEGLLNDNMTPDVTGQPKRDKPEST